MGRQSRPLTGWVSPQGRPTVAAIRGCEFRRSATLTWGGEGLETDNLDGSPPGYAARQRSRTPQHTHGETTMPTFWRNEPKVCDVKPRLLRFARNDADGVIGR